MVTRFVLFSLLFAAFSSVTYGQLVIETEKIDFIDLSDGKLYCKQADGYKAFIVNVEWDEKHNTHSPHIKLEDVKNTFDATYTIPYDRIKTLTPDEFELLFDHNKKYAIDGDRKDKSEKLTLLAKFNKDHFTIFHQCYDRKWELCPWTHVQLSAYCFIKTGDKYILMLLGDDCPSYIVPLEKGFRVINMGRKGMFSSLIEYAKVQKYTSEESVEILKDPGGVDFQSMLHYQIRALDGGGYALCNRFGANVLPQERYDTIVYNTLRYFVTKRGKEFTIYRPTLQPILIKKLRTVYTHDGNIEGIAQNKHFSITWDKREVRYWDKPKTWGRERENIDPFGLRDIMPPTTWYAIGKKEMDGYFYIGCKEHYCVWGGDIDSLYFPNQHNLWIRHTSQDPYFLNTDFADFIFMRNGKYGLATLKQKSHGMAQYSLEQVLQPIFDNIEPFADMDDIFMPNPERDRRLFLDKGGLIGLFPVQNHARYRKLKVNSVFARFVLPNGKKGWLNTYTGEEFMDE